MIFFDIDQTLLDHETAERNGALAFYKQHNKELNVTEEEFLLKWKQLSKVYYQKFLDNELSFSEQRRMRIKAAFDFVEITDQQADQLFSEYVAMYKNHWLAFEDVVPCLESLKQAGHTLAIISNGDYSQQKEKLNDIGIDYYFNHLFTSNEIGAAKPNVKIFKEACRRANVKIGDCIYVGDHFDLDYMASEKAGMKGVWINRKNDATTKMVNEIDHLDQLLEKVSMT
ncbi:HAD family hydrolase [Halalkalibacter okhensis]|uniref:HAD family hydrolase n=1 Tax=Halalkalibacter okhensis TaxID=333138 RepID=A0A0B0IF76_9BACI|nr:HAD family hydrolase [Halalkalibacter okhensis]KHF39935.1 HAD family hydrolase [Halalkalibacter okhensis]